jgi:hypothetical protein
MEIKNMVTKANHGNIADHVKCSNCGTEMLVDVGMDVCPNCEKSGCLAWVNSEQPEVDLEQLEKDLEKELERDVEEFLCKMLPEYYSYMPERFKRDIILDVMECSSFDDGYWTEDDIRIAFERDIASAYGVEI